MPEAPVPPLSSPHDSAPRPSATRAESVGSSAASGGRDPAGGRDPSADREPASSRDVSADHDAVRRAQRGDALAFEELVRRHERGALRVALNLVGRREDALDIVQEAFLRVFRNLERFDFQYEFSTWLYRIVTNQAIDFLRRRRPSFSTAAHDQDEPEIDVPDERSLAPSHALELGEEAVRVRECLAALAPHFQSVLVLREMEGLPCTEIARIVGATHVTVRWRLHRGRKLFQEEWERRARLSEQELGSSGSARSFDSDALERAASESDDPQSPAGQSPR
jgi:RNA polymerase sigma-70 factor (ECF subfamily)